MSPDPKHAALKPVVRCMGITKYFGGVQALNNVSIDLMPGEIVALVGDNGAGKSTLVKILSGIHHPDDGSIWLGDVEVEHLTPKRAREFGIETVYQQLFLKGTRIRAEVIYGLTVDGSAASQAGSG